MDVPAARAVRDLGGREDLELLLREFYRRAFDDALLRHVFVDVVQMDLERHVPVLADFWEKVLFGAGRYSGPTMQVHRRVHARVPLTPAHFDRWLQLWRETLDAMFTGDVADRADAQARRMAPVFLRNLTGGQPPRSLPVVPGA